MPGDARPTTGLESSDRGLVPRQARSGASGGPVGDARTSGHHLSARRVGVGWSRSGGHAVLRRSERVRLPSVVHGPAKYATRPNRQPSTGANPLPIDKKWCPWALTVSEAFERGFPRHPRPGYRTTGPGPRFEARGNRVYVL